MSVEKLKSTYVHVNLRTRTVCSAKCSAYFSLGMAYSIAKLMTIILLLNGQIQVASWFYSFTVLQYDFLTNRPSITMRR